MMAADLVRFNTLRGLLFKQIRAALAADGHCKSYEGALEVSWPNAHEDPEAKEGPSMITLHCYVLGSGRHHTFEGPTFSCCLDGLEAFLIDDAIETAESMAIDVPALQTGSADGS